VCQKFKGIVVPEASNLTTPWQICGIFSAKSWQPRFSGSRSPSRIRREKTSSCRKKIARIPVAFGSPQDFRIALMFGAARFGEPALSGSGSVGFRIAPRRRRWLQRLGTSRKCFNQHRIFDATRPPAAPCGLNACICAVFRTHRRA
jgi:hypothetical protein